MMRTTRTATAVLGTAAAGALALSLVAPGAVAGPAERQAGTTAAKNVTLDAKLKVRGLSADGKLLAFNTKKLENLKRFTITGLSLDTRLVGIDYRPANRVLYGVGDLGGVYTITGRGTATKVGQLTTALSGTDFGVDFNPAVDRLRIVSDTGQNLRHDVDGNATLTDAPLNTPPAAGTTAGVTAAAYTNNDASTLTGTLLFDINSTTNSVLTQTPANNGTLTSVGSLGFDVAASAGFDIYSELRNGRTVSNLGLAALTRNGAGRLYVVDLSSGQASKVKGFGTDTGIVDLAIKPTR